MVEEWPDNLWCNCSMEYYKSVRMVFSWNNKGHGESLKKRGKNIKTLPEVMSELYAYR